MTVVSFTLARFTPSDLREFNEIAGPRLARGLWASIARRTSGDSDSLMVQFPGVDRSVFKFERDKRGHYALWFNDRHGWHAIGSGHTATECLSIWRAGSRQQRIQDRAS